MSHDKAVEALAEELHATEYPKWSTTASPDHNRWSWRGAGTDDFTRDTYREEAATALAFVRDAIRADGEAGDAVREALGLRVERRYVEPITEHPEPTPVERRVVGEWQEAQP